MKYVVIVVLFLLQARLSQAEGFVAGTTVSTARGIIAIEMLQRGDCVVNSNKNESLYLITDVTSHMVEEYVKINIEDVVLFVALNQKFYVVDKCGWVSAADLVVGDSLLCCLGKSLFVDAITIIHTQKKMYALSVDVGHIFLVTHPGIIAHNIEPIGAVTMTAISFACPPAAAALALGELLAFGAICFGTYFIHKKTHNNKQHNERFVQQNNGLGNCPCGGKPPQHEDDEDKYPHGVYEDAGYHHKNSKNGKSPCPKNGQQCLDNSFPIGGSSTGRISIEDGVFVILRQTSPRKFHGYIIKTWKELCSPANKTQMIRNAFKEHGLVDHLGRIINKNV